jgi:GNAT superfamily N-acetyltransferase
MKIRTFRSTDEAAVVRLWAECGLTRPWNDPRADIARKLTEQPELFLIGEMEGEAVATAMVGFDGHRGWVYYLAVAASHRRQSFGRALMRLIALLDDIASVLDDVATLTKVATKKTAGVLGDDLALNAQQVTGVRAARELPVVWAVAKGSLLNKAILVPAALADQRVRAVGGDAAADDRRRVPVLRGLREARAQVPARAARTRPHEESCARPRRSRPSTSSRSSATRSRARSAPTSSSRPRSS